MLLDEYRKELDQIDTQLVDLFEKRMEISKKVACYKQENNLPILQPEREEQIIATRGSSVKPEIQVYTEELFRQIMRISREYQAEILAENP